MIIEAGDCRLDGEKTRSKTNFETACEIFKMKWMLTMAVVGVLI